MFMVVPVFHIDPHPEGYDLNNGLQNEYGREEIVEDLQRKLQLLM